MTHPSGIAVTLADTGVPMLYIWEPVLVLAILPIIAVEMVVLRRVLQGTWCRCFTASLIANVLSTLAGVPLTWYCLVFLQMAVDGGRARGVGVYAVTVQSPWLIPYEEHLHWMVPTAALVLCIPFLFASILCEWPIAALAFRGRPWRLVLWATTAANLASYGLLAAFWSVELIWNWGGAR